MSENGVYLHGFDRSGGSIGQSGPYPADQEAAITAGRKGLRRLGAYRIVRVEAADAAAAAVLAEEALRTSGENMPPEPRSVMDRFAKAVAAVAIKAAVRRAER